jgi:hypothetical protein
MVPLIIALSRARQLWTRAACHWRELSKLRRAVWVAKILFRRHRQHRSHGRPFRKKARSQTSTIPEIRVSPLLRTIEIPAIAPWLRLEVTFGPIRKSFRAGPHIARRAFAHVPSRRGTAHASIEIRAKTITITPEIGAAIAIGAKITRAFPI